MTFKERLRNFFFSERAKDTYERAIKTFFQAFLSALVVDIGTISASTDMHVVRDLFIGALGAGLSAVMNFVIHRLDT